MSSSAIELNGEQSWNEIELPFSKVIRSFVSGYHDSERIRIKYFIEPTDSVLYGRVWFGPEAEGPPKHAHGGAQAAVLDELCGGVAWTHGYPVLAAKLETEFYHSVPLDQVLNAEGRIKKIDGRKVYTEAFLKKEPCQLYAKATGLFIILEQPQLETLGLQAGGSLTLTNMHK